MWYNERKILEGDMEPLKPIDFYNDGKCQCKTNLKGRYIWFNTQLHPSQHIRVYMCVRCNKPIYDTLLPPPPPD